MCISSVVSADNYRGKVLRKFFEQYAHLRPATRARKQAAVACFLIWAEQQELLTANPMRKIDLVKLRICRSRVAWIATRSRAFSKQFQPSICGIDSSSGYLQRQACGRAEGLSLYVDDLDLSLDNEHLLVVEKGGKRRTILLDDPRLVQQLRAYLKQMVYKHGLLFRAEKNGRGGHYAFNRCRNVGIITAYR